MELDSNLLDDSILTARKPLTPKPLAPSEPREDELREFGDIGRTRTAIYDNVLKATQAIQPISNGRHTLRLTNVAYQDPDRFSKQQQKQAILNRQTLARRMQGVWELVDDATGDVIDRKKSVIMSVPHMTERGTFINKGTEYALKNQQRLLPGIYTRIRDNGEIESHANILPGVGQAHRYYLDPAKGMFRIKVGQGTVGIMPLLKAMGATKEQLLEAWGRDLYASNFTADDPQEYKKLKEKFLSAKEMQGDENQQREALVKKFHDMQVDPEVTKRTLGKEYSNLSLDTLLDITKKLIRVSKKEDNPDDRDSLPFQQFYGPEDLFAERIARDKDNLRRTLLWKASQRGSLKNMPSSALNKQLHAALLHSGLGIAAEEINTAELLDKATVVTRLGEGGIPSLDSIPDEARSVQPSMFGFIDPLRTPECYDEKTEVMTKFGWKFWKDITEEDEFACLVDNTLVYSKAEKLHKSHYIGTMFGVVTDSINYLVTPNHRMCTAPLHAGAEFRIELAETLVCKNRLVSSGGFDPYVGNTIKEFQLPKPDNAAKCTRLFDSVDICTWAELLGWYIGEGNSTYNEVAQQYHVKITQSSAANPANCKQITNLLNSLPFTWHYRDRNFALSTKQLAYYFKQFGNSPERYIPTECFDWPLNARVRLFDSLMKGEGRKNKRGERTCFCTSSHKLALDFQLLAFTLGYSSRIVFEPDDRPQSNTGGCWIVHVHKWNTHQLLYNRKGKSDYTTVDYDGMVYCATVPGGLLYVRREDSCGFWCGNSGRAGVDTFLARGARKGPNNKLYVKFNDARTGKPVYKTPQQLSDLTIGFPKSLERDLPRVVAMRGGKMVYVPKKDIDLVLPSMEDALNPLSNLIPNKSQVKGQRLVMASRMTTQALPVVDAESPLVQTAVPGTNRLQSFEEAYADKMGALKAQKNGRVLSVSPDEIKVQYEDGTTDTLDIYNNFPLNRKTRIHQDPVVQPGQTFTANQLLAKSNYTDKTGATALGRNARTAYMVWEGKNFEDAVVISKSFAKKMTSEHIYQHELETNDKTSIGKKKYIQHFPSKYDKKTLENLDDNGVIKPGTEVKYGDPLILGISQKDVAHNRVHKQGQVSYADSTVNWEHHDPGVVTDVVMSKNGPAVIVKSLAEMRIGDKLCYSPCTEVLTRDGWKFITDVSMLDDIASLNPITHEIEWASVKAYHRYDHAGPMYNLETTQVSLLVTDNHNLYAKRRDASAYKLEEAKSLFGRRFKLKRNGLWKQGDNPEFITLPPLKVKAGQFGNGERELPEVKVPIKTYLMLLGMFLSEGNLVNHPASGTFGFDICQIKEPNRQQMLDALNEADIKYCFLGDSKIRIHSKQWLIHLRQFGPTARYKHMPRQIFELSTELLQVFYKWIMWGDGHQGKCHTYTTISQQLADDMQHLCLLLGMSANIKSEAERLGFIKGKQYVFQRKYTLSIYRSKNEPEINHGHCKQQGGQLEQWLAYNGNVYCVTLNKNHIMYTRRKGKPVWCGNSGRFGDKGILADIIDDEAMPKDAQGRPFEVLANPLGLVTRVNPGQMAELWLGKLAELQGKPFKVEDFDDSKDLINWVKEQLQQNNLKALEDVFDPKNDKKISNIATGNRFFMKLHHMAEAKSQGRSGGAYTAEGAPAKGGVEGCFAPKQNILTIQGYKNISEICEKKLGVQVRTFSESLKEWVYRPVVDWFTYRAKVDDLLSVHTIGGPCEKDSRTNRTHSVMYMTKNHYVFTYDGRKVTANELTINDKLVTWGPIPTEDQKAFIAGTLLGDATADFNGISFEHSVKQIEYVNWKSYVLNGLNAKSCDTVHDMSQNPDFKTKRCLAKVVWIAETHVCDYYTKLCYDNNHIKRVTPEWLAQLNDLSIAMWVLDDGSISNRAKKKGRINYTGNITTHGFDYESKQLLVDWLNNRLATDCIINAVGAINLTSDACRKLIPIIAKYVPWEVIPKSKKFLIKEVMKLQKVQPPTKLNTTCELGKVPLIISKIEKYKHDKPDVTEINVYDFTVKDTHTYVASHALVSNSKRIGILESNALLAHGATDTLQDVISVRSNKNQDYWLQYMQGYNPKIEKVPYAYEKFVNQLKASGVNVVRKGTQQHIMALTDKDIDELAGDRELTNASGVDWGRGLQELPGGLFDKSKTGGHGGNQWSYFKLHEPMPNPVMEEPIRRILGLTQAKFEGILSGETQLDKYGTGPQAIKKALENINIAKEIELARNVMNGGKASQRDAAVRKLGYLKAAQKLGLSLADYTLTKVPVIPPSFRPVSVMSNDMPLVNDANYLYKELFEANENLKKIQANLGTEASGAERLATYRAFKAVTGLGDPIGVKTQEKNVQGFLKNVFGSSPKFGCYDDKTEILTQQGWVNFADYKGNVPVATLNPNTNAFEWQLPTDVYHWDYNGELFEFSTARGLDSVVTPNHRNFVRNRTGKKSADNMNTGWCIEPAYITAADGNRKWFRTAASNWVGHRLRPKFLPLSCKLKDFAAFVGWWVAEGWLGDRKKDRIQLCQAIKNKANCKRIDELVDSLGLPCSKGKYLRKGKFGECWVWQWSIRSKELAQWLTVNAGLLAENKKLSNKIKDWDTPFLREFFLGYLGGDGTRRYLPRQNKGGITHKNHSALLDQKQSANTTSEQLAGNMQEIACKLGITARLVLRPTEEVNCHDLYKINLSGSAFVVTEGKDKAKIIKYTGQVHCVSVPNGIVYVRRNGKPLFSGNSLQRKLISTTVDNVGRGVISPDPNLDMDQVGIPEDKAFKIYERFVTRNLVRRGMSLREAREAVKNKTKVAREMLNEEMERRPVYISRAPVLHKFGILAAKPQITKGDVLRVSPLVVKGFGADFDGNCCDYDTELYLQVDSSLLGLWSVDQLQSWESLIMRTCGTTLLDVAGEDKSFKVKIGDIPRQGKGFKGKDGQTIYNLPEGLSVLSYDPETCKPIYTPITKITIDENHACREVKTRSGRSVIVSDNESLCVFDTELGQVRKMKPTDAVGKLSPYVKQYPIVGNQFSFELGWWYAVLAADGWKQEFLVGYSKNDIASRKEFERIARECILDAFNVNEYADKDRPNKFGDSVKIHLSGKHFVKKVLDVVHPDHKDHPEDRAALYKKLPDVLLYNGSRECLLGLLSGAIDGDASVGWNTTNKNRRFFCRFNTSSPYLVESYKELLARLGVRYSVTVTPAKGQSKTSYTVCPSVTDLFKILPECRLVNAERKAIVAEFLATTESLKDDLDIVPISSDLANILSKLLIQQKNLYGLLRSAVSSGKLGRGTAKKVLELVPELDHDHYMIFTHIVNGDHIHWDPIVSATEVEARDVFDLEVPETKVFSANNGLIIWDTMNYHVPSTDAAVKEAYERLLPSKNLFSLADFKSVMHKPANEYITGLYFATQPSSDKPTRIFRNKSDMMKAYESGAIDYNDKIRILEP